MILDVFSEMQRARPEPGFERVILQEAIEQAVLADELGYGCWWNVEHHGAPRFSFSSAPEMMPVLLSQHTRNLRFGHSGILAPFRINHPLRVAERAAFADIASGGRLELGLARSGGAEWETFGVDPETSREQLREAMRMIPRMWTQERFSWKSDLLTIPEREVVPKPLQRPHPPLWQTSNTLEGSEMAGSLGVGLLATTLLTPLSSLAEVLASYTRAIERCEPAGAFVNEQRAVFTYVHCTETREQAIQSRAAESALWFVNAAPKIFRVPRSIWIDMIRGQLRTGDPANITALAPGAEAQDEGDPDDPVPVIRLLNRQLRGMPLDPEEVYEVLEALDSVVIGDVDTCRRKLKAFADLGVDRLMALMQFGSLTHEDIMRSLRITGEVLLPDLASL